MSWSELKELWNRTFHTPAPCAPLGCFRILLGLLVLAHLALLWPDLEAWYGPHGVISRETARTVSGGRGWSLFDILPPHAAASWVFWGCALGSVGMTIGLLSRGSAILVFVTLVSLHHRNPLILNSGDAFLRICCFFMMFAPLGASCSVDRLIAIARGKVGPEPATAPPWAARLIQFQLALVYLHTFLWKVRGSDWLDGTALYYSSRLADFWRFPVPYLFEHLWTIKLLTWGTLAVELALGLFLWVREWRPWILLSGVLLHLGIGYSMNIPLFAPTMLSAYVLFLNMDSAQRCLRALDARVRRLLGVQSPLAVFYDGNCAFCTRAVDCCRAMDILGRLRFFNSFDPDSQRAFPDLDTARGGEEILTRAPAGRWRGGFFAVRTIACHLPAAWPLLPLLWLPGVPWIGVRIYRWIASRRLCLVRPAAAGRPLP